jgi:hypothetical protein
MVSRTTATEGTTLEEAVEEFNQFLADEAMAYQDMAVQALPA